MKQIKSITLLALSLTAGQVFAGGTTSEIAAEIAKLELEQKQIQKELEQFQQLKLLEEKRQAVAKARQELERARNATTQETPVVREVRRTVEAPRVARTAKHTWYFRRNNGEAGAYPGFAQKLLNKWYNRYLNSEKSVFNLNISGDTYRIDFAKKMQTNITDGFEGCTRTLLTEQDLWDEWD